MNKIYLVALITILRREMNRFLRIWIQTLLPSAITTTLYFLIFGQLIGTRVGLMEGFTYMQYIAPGLIMMQIITNAYTNVVFSVFSARFQKSIEEMIVAPIPQWVILLGYTFGGIARSLIIGAIVTVIALFFTHLHIHNLFIILSTALLSATLFSLAGFTNSLFAKKFDDVSIVPTFILTPLTYLGGVFYSMSALPIIWQKISLLNPIVYVVNAFRYGILGSSDISIYAAFGILIFSCVFLFILNLRLLHKGVGIRT